MRRSGFTITEVLVSISVIGLLMSLVVPAVQSARASARLTECRNRLKQIGVAIHVVQESNQRFTCEYGILLRDGMGTHSQATGSTAVVNSGFYQPEFQCPADPVASTPETGQSYVMSNGTWLASGVGYLNLGSYTPSNPSAQGFREASEFTDGLSQTAAFSETALWTMADQLHPQDDPKKHALWLSTPANYSGNAQDFIDLCRNPQNTAIPLIVPLQEGYTHLFTPNTRGCWTNSPVNRDPRLSAYLPANSYHTGGVSVLFVDGHVSFVSDSVDAQVWQAIGTIHGNESIGSSF